MHHFKLYWLLVWIVCVWFHFNVSCWCFNSVWMEFFLCYQRLAPAVKWLKLPQNQKCQFGQYFFNHKMPQVTKIFPVSAYFVSCTSIEDCQPKRHHIFPIFNEIDIMIIRHFWNVSHQNRYEIHFPRARNSTECVTWVNRIVENFSEVFETRVCKMSIKWQKDMHIMWRTMWLRQISFSSPPFCHETQAIHHALMFYSM